MMITRLDTGDTGRIISLASCIIIAKSAGSQPNPATTEGAIGTNPFLRWRQKDANCEDHHCDP